MISPLAVVVCCSAATRCPHSLSELFQDIQKDFLPWDSTKNIAPQLREAGFDSIQANSNTFRL